MKCRRFFFGALALLMAILLLGCAAPATPAASDSPAPPTATATPSATPLAVPDTPTPSAARVLPETSAPTPTIAPSPTPKGPTMYSSYADLISFDPESGIAKFDYFDMLRGNEAVDFLVDHEGYTKAAAQDMVENFADSEFVKKNTNPQLRAIDIDDVPLKLMVKPNGDPVDGAESVSVTASDFRAIYALNTSLLLESYFYYIHVDVDGKVTLVEQVYWP